MLRRILQERYEVLDCTSYDNGTQASHNDSIWTSSNCTLTRNTDYSLITKSTGNANLITPMLTECMIEFDFLQEDGYLSSFIGYFKDANNNNIVGFSLNHLKTALGGTVNLNEWYHITLRIQDNNMYFGNDTTVIRTLSESPSKFAFFLANGGIDNVRFKNFKVYPI